MKTYDIFKLSLSHVRKSKMRSWLTIVGIVIGVAAIVAIISIGAGMQASVQKSLGSLGGDLITVYAPSTSNLTDKDMTIIKQVPGILYVSGVVSGMSEILLGNEKASVSISGIDTTVWRSTITTDIESGRYLQPGDSNSVVIGYSLAHDLFLQPITQNRPITIGGKTFKVVGIFARSGGFGGTDTAVYMPADSARDVITDPKERNQFSSITVKIADQNLADKVTADINQKLMMSRHVNPRTKDFTVIPFASIQQQVSSITLAITMFLGSIAAVSLLVGAVGIANTMFMSVMERTRQIGLLKALGATDNEVMKLFLIESGLFGVVGGVIGITVGILISVLITAIGPQMIGQGGAMTTVIPPSLIIFALAFSIITGVLSGVIPARNAAKMNPVDALRIEQ
ncbi:MAG: ABC transporter permease [Candidatus Methanoperedens sp.]|nr:ABC transporter permease [Candidatus Methanoperedens sp.]MCZ7405832.1 ABC transporter permease [Candidatus Methanoperedens sp.]